MFLIGISDFFTSPLFCTWWGDSLPLPTSLRAGRSLDHLVRETEQVCAVVHAVGGMERGRRRHEGLNR